MTGSSSRFPTGSARIGSRTCSRVGPPPSRITAARPTSTDRKSSPLCRRAPVLSQRPTGTPLVRGEPVSPCSPNCPRPARHRHDRVAGRDADSPPHQDPGHPSRSAGDAESSGFRRSRREFIGGAAGSVGVSTANTSSRSSARRRRGPRRTAADSPPTSESAPTSPAVCLDLHGSTASGQRGCSSPGDG